MTAATARPTDQAFAERCAARERFTEIWLDWLFHPTRIARIPRLHLLLVGISAVVGLLAIYANPIINPDGILYLTAADRFAEGRFDEAVGIYNWPLYPFLMAGLMALGVPTAFAAAQVLNMVAIIGAQLGVVALARALFSERLTIACVAIVVLVLPTFTDIRGMIVKDTGFSLFFAWSVYATFRAATERSWLFGLAAIICAALAAGFRIEGLALFLILPTLWVMLSYRSNWLIFAASLIPFVLLSLVPLAAKAVYSGDGFDVLFADGFFGGVIDSWMWLFSNDNPRFVALQNQVLFPYEMSSAGWLYALIPAMMTLGALVDDRNLFIAVLWLTAFLPFLHIRDYRVLVTVGVTVIGMLAVYIGFGIITYTMPTRYTIAVLIILCQPAGVSLMVSYRWWERPRWPGDWIWIWLPILVVALAGTFILSIPRTTPAVNIGEASDWINANVEPSAKLLTNDGRIAYYTGRGIDFDHTLRLQLQTTDDNAGKIRVWRDFDIVALSFNEEQTAQRRSVEAAIGEPPVAGFKNRSREEILIYDLRD